MRKKVFLFSKSRREKGRSPFSFFRFAAGIVKFCPKEAARKVEKLLLSAIANWSVKNEGQRVDDAALYIKEIFVDGAGILKRLRPAPQGRAHRIRKRSNHVTIVLGSKTAVVENTVKE